MSSKKIDTLYLQGREQEDSFAFYYANLRPLLRDYAQSIGRQTQKVIDEHLVDEMVDDLLMEIGEFQGRSSFSTWAYVRFHRRWIDEYRFQRKNIGESLESKREATSEYVTTSASERSEYPAFSLHDGCGPQTVSESDMDQRLIVEEFKRGLSDRQRLVLEEYLAGHTFEQIAEQLDVTGSRAQQIWSQVLVRAEEYGMTGLGK